MFPEKMEEELPCWTLGTASPFLVVSVLCGGQRAIVPHCPPSCVAVTLKSLTHVTVTCSCEEKLLTAAGQGIPVTVLLRG